VLSPRANPIFGRARTRNRASLQPERRQCMRAAWETWNAAMPPIPEDATVSLGCSVKDMPQR